MTEEQSPLGKLMGEKKKAGKRNPQDASCSLTLWSEGKGCSTQKAAGISLTCKPRQGDCMLCSWELDPGFIETCNSSTSIPWPGSSDTASLSGARL